jgi:hypothetical protein
MADLIGSVCNSIGRFYDQHAIIEINKSEKFKNLLPFGQLVLIMNFGNTFVTFMKIFTMLLLYRGLGTMNNEEF